MRLSDFFHIGLLYRIAFISRVCLPPLFRFSMLFTLLDYYSTMVKIGTLLRSSYKGTHWILSICYYMEIGMANVTVETVPLLVCRHRQQMQGLCELVITYQAVQPANVTSFRSSNFELTKTTMITAGSAQEINTAERTCADILNLVPLAKCSTSKEDFWFLSTPECTELKVLVLLF